MVTGLLGYVLINQDYKIMNGRTAKQKGKQLENWVMDEIIKRGLDDRAIRDGASGASNKEKRDVATNIKILDREIGIECKNHKVPHIKDWWLQTQKLEQLGYEPVLIYKLFGESLGDCKSVVYTSTLLDLIANQKDSFEQTGIPSSEKWLIKKAIDVLKSLLKVFEKYCDQKTLDKDIYLIYT